ncbi:hypothetical protein Trydic_g21777 [Trypoxylus dichotomus]
MIFRLKFKYKYVCAVIVFIVISLFLIFFTAASRNGFCRYSVEPIDVVYTWVNGSDPEFVNSLINHTGQLPAKSVDKSTTRYFDRHELKFSLRSLEKYASWIRNVYIITNGQIPYWLNLDYEKVFLVTHEDIFTDPYHLPTFSSPAIETHIHRIPGLSKKFLYFNDDIYLGAPIYLSDFYTEGRGYYVYLDYPMQSCAKGCPWMYVHDGQCDTACNVAACQMDGGDCESVTTNLVRFNERTPYPDVGLFEMPPIKINFINSSQQSTNVRLKNVIELLPPSTNKSSVRRLIETHNRNKMLEEKLKRRKQKTTLSPSELKKTQYFDAYRESLQYTNRLFNTRYGFIPRYVPAHMPFLIDRDIVGELQAAFRREFKLTSRNKLRSANDMQFSFSYFHFLISEKVDVDIGEIFDDFDTDESGTWSDREIRTILTRLNELPLTTASIDEFDELLINCSKAVRPNEVPTPEYERYIDSVLPTISKELITGCSDIREILLERFGRRSRYLHEIIKNVSKFVTFEMIQSDILSTVLKLDRIRRNPTKFVCINDNVYKKYNISAINAIWYDFYLSLFPLPSKFELPMCRESELRKKKEARANQSASDPLRFVRTRPRERTIRLTKLTFKFATQGIEFVAFNQGSEIM